MSIDNADNDPVLIPCDICHEIFPFEEYIIHSASHTSNPTTNQLPTIPCEYPNCNIQIPFEDYETHRISHLDSSTVNTIQTTAHPTNNTSNNEQKQDTFLIPCEFDGCDQMLPITEYEAHQMLHISISSAMMEDTNTSQMPSNCNTNNAQDGSFLGFGFDDLQVLKCEFEDCEQQWIPVNEYSDHIQLHKIQNQIQNENTSSDAMIALEQQLQNVQEFTSNNNTNNVMSTVNNCTSKSFEHLKGSQYPNIPISGVLSQHSRSNYVSINNAFNRDLHGATGIIQALHFVFAKKPHIEYYLCDPLIFYYRGLEDYSWGCGFRNMQTLTSSLLQPMGSTPNISRIRFNSTNNVYSSVLFNGVGYVPNITQIQRYLDHAHEQGFDVHGFGELGFTEGRRVWIGAIDVAAVLRSFSIPAAIFDFTVNSKYDEHKALFDWVWQYFEQRYKYYGKPVMHGYANHMSSSNNNNNVRDEPEDSFTVAKKMGKYEMEEDDDSGDSVENPYQKFQTSGSKKSENNRNTKSSGSLVDVNGNSKMNVGCLPMVNVLSDDSGDSDYDQPMVGEKKSDFSNFGKNAKKKKMKITDYWPSSSTKKKNKNGRRFIPPLYFQHQGHSRSIIGMIFNRKSGLRHLLILDPSVKKGALNLLENVQNGNISQLLRSIKQINALKYQIVCVPAKGLMLESDRNQCKNMQSLNVSS